MFENLFGGMKLILVGSGSKEFIETWSLGPFDPGGSAETASIGIKSRSTRKTTWALKRVWRKMLG